jgi:signal transduction histidine kinase
MNTGNGAASTPLDRAATNDGHLASRRYRQLTVVLPALALLVFLLTFEVARAFISPPAAIIGAFAVGYVGLLAFSRSMSGLMVRLRSQNAQLQALRRAAVMVAANMSLDTILQTVADLSRDLTKARYAAIFIGPGDSIEDVVTSGLTARHRETLLDLRLDGVAGRILRSDQPFRSTDVRQESGFKGIPEGLPPQSGSLLTVPLFSEGTVAGHIFAADRVQGGFTQEDQDALEALAVQASIAIKNARLFEAAAQVAALKERERIGLELHDGLIQQLYGLSLGLEGSLEALDSRPELVREDIESAIEGLNRAIRDVRSHIFNLRPSEFEGKGLSEALSEMLRDLEVNSLMTTHLVVESGVVDPGRCLSDAQRSTVLLAADTALEDVRKRSQAHSVRVEIEQKNGKFKLRIVDDGIVIPQNGEDAGKDGLPSIRDRVVLLGGDLRVDTPQGGGTAVSVTMPVGQTAEAAT